MTAENSEEDLLIRISLTEKQYLQTLARLEARSVQAANGAEKAFKKSNSGIARSAANLNKATSKSSNGLRQMSMQLSQVAQQGAVTGNYLQALAIQAPDLALGFGAIGIAAGALVPVIYGVAQGFLAGSEDAETLEDRIKDLSTAVARFQDAGRSLSNTDGLLADYGAMAQEAQKYLELERQIAEAAAQRAFGGAVGSVAAGFGLQDLGGLSPEQLRASSGYVEKLVEQYELLRIEAERTGDVAEAALKEQTAESLSDIIVKLEGAGDAFNGLSEKLGISRDQAQELAALFADVNAAQGANAQAAAMQRLAQHISDATDGLAKADEETLELYDNLMKAAGEAFKLAAVDMATNIGAGADEAARLHTNLLAAAQVIAAGTAMDATVASVGGDVDFFDPRGSDYGSEGSGKLNPSRGPGKSKLSATTSRSGGGSSGAGTNPILAQLEALQNSLMTQEETQIASFQRQQETLEQALAQKLLTQQEYADLMEQAQRDHSERMSQIDVYRYGSGLQQTEAFLGDMASALQGGNEKMQKVAQTFGAIEGLINAYRAYNQTLADPSLPFFAKFAAATAVLGAGLQAVSAIKGAGSGGGGAGAAGAATASTPQVSRNVAVQIQGDVFGQDHIRSLINQINEAQEDGAIVRLV